MSKRDAYLRSKYCITEEQYNQIGEAQGWKCAICGRKAEGKLPLVVDHVHFRISTEKFLDPLNGKTLMWFAVTIVNGIRVAREEKTKTAAIKAVREEALPLSVRGLLCPGRHGKAPKCCNRNLGRVDCPTWLRAAADYLDDPPARKVLTRK